MTSAKRKRLYIHIGTHKTGSSSLQHWLGSIREQLEQIGFAYFTGAFEPDNHVELFAVPMRPGREAFARGKYGIVGSEAELESVRDRFRDFAARHSGHDLILSCEGLSLLRFDDEIERFRSIIEPTDREVIVVLVLRNKADFLDSFRRQIIKHRDRELSDNPSSIRYVEPDSWLADYDAIEDVWSRSFPSAPVRVIDYDQAIKQEDDVLPALLRAMDLPDAVIPESGTIRINADGWRQIVRRTMRKVGIRL